VPTAAVIDSQTVRAADTVPTASSGYDGGKKIKGRKRHVAVDTGGLLLAVVVTTASLQDRDGAFRITAALREAFSTITLVWADAGPGTQAGSSVTRARPGTWPWRSSSAPTRPRACPAPPPLGRGTRAPRGAMRPGGDERAPLLACRSWPVKLGAA
jgi:hypothetical protein